MLDVQIYTKPTINRTRLSQYPFEKLEVGEMFIVPLSEGDTGHLRAVASQKGKKLGRKFSVSVKSSKQGDRQVYRTS